MKNLHNTIIRLSDKKFERVFTFWFIIFVVIAIFVYTLEGFFGTSHNPQWYDFAYLIGYIFGYIGTLRRLKEIL